MYHQQSTSTAYYAHMERSCSTLSRGDQYLIVVRSFMHAINCRQYSCLQAFENCIHCVDDVKFIGQWLICVTSEDEVAEAAVGA